MAKIPSKSKQTSASSPSSSSPAPSFFQRLGRSIVRRAQSLKTKFQQFRHERIQPHRTFRRSYREDYVRETPSPSLLSHAVTTFQILFKNWRIFLPFIALMSLLYIVCVGLLSEDVYVDLQKMIDDSGAEIANGRLGNFAKAGLLLISTVTSGGLDSGMGESQMVLMLILFVIMWMVTIYLLRHLLAGEKPRLRDGLYNALGPLISSAIVLLVIFVQALPLMFVTISYSAAVRTDFLATPFYALVYFIFAALMILLSGYLLSSSLIAMVAVTVPGTYPLVALSSASDLMVGRRLKFVLRTVYLCFVVAVTYVVTMLPIILLDLWLKSTFKWLSGWPIVSCWLLFVTCFVFIYATAYIYRYYRLLLDYPETGYPPSAHPVKDTKSPQTPQILRGPKVLKTSRTGVATESKPPKIPKKSSSY